MNLQNALLLTTAAYGLVELAKALIGKPWNTNPRVLVGLAISTSFAATFLVAHTAWAHTQVIGDKPLDELGDTSLILVAFMVAGAQTGLWAGVQAARNIGQNQLSAKQQAALDIMAERETVAPLPPRAFAWTPTPPAE